MNIKLTSQSHQILHGSGSIKYKKIRNYIVITSICSVKIS